MEKVFGLFKGLGKRKKEQPVKELEPSESFKALTSRLSESKKDNIARHGKLLLERMENLASDFQEEKKKDPELSAEKWLTDNKKMDHQRMALVYKGHGWDIEDYEKSRGPAWQIEEIQEMIGEEKRLTSLMEPPGAFFGQEERFSVKIQGTSLKKPPIAHYKTKTIPMVRPEEKAAGVKLLVKVEVPNDFGELAFSGEEENETSALGIAFEVPRDTVADFIKTSLPQQSTT